MMPKLDPANWYWIVAGDQTRAFSSATGDYVPVNNPAFVVWKGAGNVPTNIDTEDNLGEVLAQHLARPIHTAVLDGYKGSHAKEVAKQAAFKIAFNHENRIRAIERALNLNGSPANITAPQALNVIKGLM